MAEPHIAYNGKSTSGSTIPAASKPSPSSQDQNTEEPTEREWHSSLGIPKTASDEKNGSFFTSSDLSKPCAFGSEIFSNVMENLIRNPNITSSHLFRADVYYDSEKDASFSPGAWTPSIHQSLSSLGLGEEDDSAELSSFIKHIKKELRPKKIEIEGFELKRLLVRRMVPRNPGLDRDLVQTCCFLRSKERPHGRHLTTDKGSDGQETLESCVKDEQVASQNQILERYLVVLLPHVEAADDMPWYHPKVKAVGFLHEWDPVLTSSQSGDMDCVASTKDQMDDNKTVQGKISIHIIPFPSATGSGDSPFDEQNPVRLHRTLQHLLQTITRHGAGQLAGYKKRTHYDRLIQQSALQDTYTRLKQKHAKYILHECWKETTDATKGVFEDLGIAAFLIELWRDMYAAPDAEPPASGEKSGRPPFPGFVDIGCGNGVLVYILLSEGYTGGGFDARMRKTWKEFPAAVQANLERRILIPSVLSAAANQSPDGDETETRAESLSSASVPIHDGRFRKGTFIVSNHADELSAWTPLLAYLSDCPFICIPCCSHDLSGARFRAPASFVKEDELASTRSSDANPALGGECESSCVSEKLDETVAKPQSSSTAESAPKDAQNPPAANKQNDKPTSKPQQPSAYASLTAYIAHLARAVGYEAEKEVLRIPSTRNYCIVGRRQASAARPEEVAVENSSMGKALLPSTVAKETQVRGLVERETRKSSLQVRELWCARAGKISNPTNGLDSSSKH